MMMMQSNRSCLAQRRCTRQTHRTRTELFSEIIEQPDFLHRLFTDMGANAFIYMATVSKLWRDIYTNLYSSRNSAVFTSKNMLMFARANGLRWSTEVVKAIAGSGNLESLQWAKTDRCPRISAICAAAAENGHLEVLQWAHANGCDWNCQTCALAAENGHLAVLQWARVNDCPWDWETCANAA